MATFSYKKDLSVAFFQNVWDNARSKLRRSQRWLFIGYSMPEADIEIRHLLKSAQLARSNPEDLKIHVILKDDSSVACRYERFFGSSNVLICHGGFSQWAESDFEDVL